MFSLLPLAAQAARVEWFLAALLGLAAIQLFVLHRLLRTRSPTPEPAADGPTVECSECGTENRRGYRYCRACVSELPGAADLVRRSRSLGRPSP